MAFARVIIVMTLVLTGANTARAFSIVAPILHESLHRSRGTPRKGINPSTTTNIGSSVPTIDELRSDPFMAQVKHAEFVQSLLQDDSSSRQPDDVMTYLQAQLSHPNGIRGFMVTYLSSSTSDDALDDVRIPDSLVTAVVSQMDDQTDANQLIALMCMNVIMPTAMATMHQTPELAQQSAQTATRATALVQAVLERCNNRNDHGLAKKGMALLSQCRAILQVATPNTAADDSVADNDIKYWTEFFDKWGYQAQQKLDIAATMQCVVEHA